MSRMLGKLSPIVPSPAATTSSPAALLRLVPELLRPAATNRLGAAADDCFLPVGEIRCCRVDP